ncbi:phosphoenolpyruvate--protein phosphotransferase [Nocardioides panacisoli]|uniref:phosphoenolpyruvate--protein phosphotransferase n=1 Tax=Nocardioides panacisoli TaxID=627624 RepID=UPI001C636DF9|nr:phosphoenolpyruvate--protein phosphotransferase [Nocardioides panacisoli]QYJ05654.1 phosphoenolpyruvate--protein phosphotransferase [Nocardioides panacisoli]
MVTLLHGTPVVPGIAYGPTLVASDAVPAEAVAAYGDGGHADVDAALAAYDAATRAVADGLQRRAASAAGATAQVLTASAGLTTDRGLRSAVSKHLRAGEDLVPALGAAIEQFVTVFTTQGGLMAERATDLRDIHGRVLAHLVGAPEPGVPTPEEPSILVAEDLAPADTAELDPSVVLAIVTERGGPTSHTAIIARQLGIPCVVGTAGALDLAAGVRVLVDGTAGTAEVEPDEATATERVAEHRRQRAALEGWSGPGSTADGHPVKLLANVADGESARTAGLEPVAGVGLFRTELCFLNRDTEPSVDEQAAIYAEVFTPYADEREVVARTLDAGSDKPIAFASHTDEDNPALGVRGYRLCAGNPGLLERQLDAIAEAARRSGVATSVMAPMIATPSEARAFATLARARGLRAGVMIEVPSAAIQARQILDEVDFCSLGTNDLTQYTMAADRMATDLAHLTDPWQPAVLHLVSLAAAAGRAADKPVGVCGEAAADPQLAAVLVGLGVTSLSMAAAAVRSVGARLGDLTLAQCEAAAAAALAAPDPASARTAATTALA